MIWVRRQYVFGLVQLTPPPPLKRGGMDPYIHSPTFIYFVSFSLRHK